MLCVIAENGKSSEADLTRIARYPIDALEGARVKQCPANEVHALEVM